MDGRLIPPDLDDEILWVVEDITARRQAQEQLRLRWRALEASPASIVITDSAGNIQYANPKFVEVTGYSLQEVISQNPRILKSGEDAAGSTPRSLANNNLRTGMAR